MPSNTPIVFPTVTLNEGNGYNASDGIFKAPISGVYTFNAHICNVDTNFMVVAIMKGSTQLAITTVYEDKVSSCGSVDTIVRLQKGDEVNVVAKFTASYLAANEYRWCSFTGYFLFE